MRDAGYLKQFPLEESDAFTDRKSIAVLFNFYEKCKNAMVGMILRRDPEIVDTETTSAEFADTFREHWENIDNAGTHGAVFTAEFLDEMFAGHAFIVVDAPPLADLSDKAAQKAAGWRPYWNIYSAKQAINWRVGVVNNQTVLTQITFEKTYYAPDGDFGEREVEEYKTYTLLPDGVRYVTRQAVTKGGTKEKEFVIVPEKSGTIPGMRRLPVALGYGCKKGIGESQPPLKDVAYHSVWHFNKQSDYNKADDYAGLVFMVEIGKSNFDQAAYDLKIHCEEGGDFQLRETTGQALEAKRALLDRIEAQMMELGLALLVDRTKQDLTATQAVLDNTQKTSDLQRIAVSCKDAIETAIEIHADFMNVPAEVVPGVDLGFKADQLVISPQTASILLQAANTGQLSTEDFLQTLKSGGVMPDAFNVEEALANLKTERAETERKALAMAANAQTNNQPSPPNA